MACKVCCLLGRNLLIRAALENFENIQIILTAQTKYCNPSAKPQNAIAAFNFSICPFGPLRFSTWPKGCKNNQIQIPWGRHDILQEGQFHNSEIFQGILLIIPAAWTLWDNSRSKELQWLCPPASGSSFRHKWGRARLSYQHVSKKYTPFCCDQYSQTPDSSGSSKQERIPTMLRCQSGSMAALEVLPWWVFFRKTAHALSILTQTLQL